MNNKLDIDLDLLEGRTFILGREGHIYIDSSRVSKHHAQLKIINGKIHLRDLNSTNGTYLVRNNKLVYFEKGFVNPLQSIALGGEKHRVIDLLVIAGNFVATDDSETEVDIDNLTGNRQVNS